MFVWKKDYGEIKIREHKSVDGKDKVRSELRRLLRRTVTTNAVDRKYIKELRQMYRDSLRRERTYYWSDRIKPCHFPELWITNISDGATQRSVSDCTLHSFRARVCAPCARARRAAARTRSARDRRVRACARRACARHACACRTACAFAARALVTHVLHLSGSNTDSNCPLIDP
jgi:hypothetical protein